jgi:hypothetical protein
MPTNLPPEYYNVEERLKAATSPEDKVTLTEELLATVPKHKGTDKLRASLRQKLSKLKNAAESHKKINRQESAFHIDREGPARLIVVGAPNVGKSALVAKVTHATPAVSEAPFTTWIPTPGMMPIRDIQLQLIDTPSLSREHVEPELFNLLRTADLLLILVDIQSRSMQQLDDAVEILEEHHVVPTSGDDSLEEGRGNFCIPCLVLVNKADDESWDEEVAVLRELEEDRLPMLPVSVSTGRNIEKFREDVFERLELIRVYSKQPHHEADRSAPFVLRQGDTVDDFAAKVHKDFLHRLKTARVWGAGVHDGQPVGRDHVLHDGDIVELHMAH